MRRLIIMMALCLSGIFTVFSKDIAKFHVSLDYHYSMGLSQRGLGETVYYGETKMHGNSITLTGLWDINDLFSSGIGFGFTGYTYAPNTLPVFATFRYRPFYNERYREFYAFSNLGYSVPADDDRQLSSGFLFDLGIGWQKMFRRHFGINFQLGYALKQFRALGHGDWDSQTEVFPEFKFSLWRNSLFLGFGLVF